MRFQKRLVSLIFRSIYMRLPWGGVMIISLMSFGVAAPSISTVALIGAIPMSLAVILVAIFGVETCKLRLEEITETTLKNIPLNQASL